MDKNGDNNSNKYTKVLIIGAGMAGLSAANHLIKNGFKDFKILEARNRIGGRIIQIDIGSAKIELGANWIHGVLGNPIYELAMSNSLIDINFSPKPHKIIAATEDGKQIPFSLLQEIYEAYTVFFKRCEEYYLCQYLPPTGIHSVGDHIKLEINLFLDRISDINERHIRQLIFNCLLKRESCITGCDNMSEIDLLEIGSYTELQGGNIVLPAGYSSIIGPASKHIPPESIVLNCPVKTINWYNNMNNLQQDLGNDSDDSDRTVTGDEPSVSRESALKNIYIRANAEVVCENGEKLYADHVICTIPLGVLKENVNTLFCPPLPEDKFEAIERLLFGTVDKIFLEYDRPFLNPEISEVMLLWEINLPSTSRTEEEDITNNWFKKIYSFSKLSDTLLLGWVSGLAAEYMETLPSEEIAEKCTELLRKFLNDPFVPKPRKCIW